MTAPTLQLGVDFGTSNTVAVLRWADGRSRPLLFDGSPLLPSAVYAQQAGALVVGRDAVNSSRLEPARFEPNPKRRIDDGAVLLGDREVPVVALMTAVLAQVAYEVRRTLGGSAAIAGTTLTCPASWGATRRLTLSDAAAAAGLGQVRLVAEPVAAATYFTQVLGRAVPIGSVVVVYDFGAGTFDASVVARTSSGFEVLAVDGRDDIGGLDIDEAVIELVGRGYAQRAPAAWQRLMNPSTVDERRARRLLYDDARGVKERLSRNQTADLTLPLIGSDLHVTRDELEASARPLIDQTIRVTQGVMRWANLAEGRLAGVFLVGGSSRIPLVATLLHRALGEPPVAIEQPELVVAEGSVLAGAAALPLTAVAAPGPNTGALRARSDVPVSGVPVSGVPVSGVPVSGSPFPGQPGSSFPVSPPPAYFSPGRARAGPPVAQSLPMHQAVESRPLPARVAPVASPAPYYTLPAGSAVSSHARVARPGRFGLVVRRLLVFVLLAATPLVAAYLAYKLTVGEPLWPVTFTGLGS